MLLLIIGYTLISLRMKTNPRPQSGNRDQQQDHRSTNRDSDLIMIVFQYFNQQDNSIAQSTLYDDIFIIIISYLRYVRMTDYHIW